MLLLLLACADGKPGGAPAADTAASDTDPVVDTGDTDAPVDAWVAPEVPCALSHPRAVAGEEVPPFWDLYGPDALELYVVAYELHTYERLFGCPTPTEDLVTGAITWEGDCSSPEFSWEGRWISTVSDDAIIEEGEGARFEDAYWNVGTVAFDGYSAYEEDGDGVATTVRDFTWSADGFILPDSEGDWIVQSYERWVPDGPFTLEGRFDVSNSDVAPPGDYCVVREELVYPGCEAEPWGGWVLVGDATLVVNYDPHVACDGCGAVTIDGVPAGEYCGY